MLTVHKLSKAYGLNQIIDEITFSVNAGERVGLIGSNGSGKSTLLRLLTDQEKPDKGTIQFSPSGLRVGYLAQGFEPDPDLTISDLLHQYGADPALLEEEIAQLAQRLVQEPAREELQIAYDTALQKLSQSNIHHTQSLLNTFNLDNIKPDLPIGLLSGGQKTRLTLLLVLLNNPQLLLLDEPTNHLDIEMLEWLENWLISFNGGVLIVSHDRTFLDHIVNRIIYLDMDTHQIREYAGHYSDYLNQFLHEREKQWQRFNDQEYEIRRMRQDIARTREQANSVERSTTPRQPNVRRIAKKVMNKAKSREKKLERYIASDERVEKPSRSWQMKLELADSPHLGKDVLTLDNLAVGYEAGNPLLWEMNQQVQAGQRLLITGPNGAGKTTLLRTIVGDLRSLSGHIHLGSSVRLGYMSQEQENLDPELSALEIIQQAAPLNETDARSFLHFFLFTGDDPLRPTADLSFGERARLSLARLIASGCNLLLLDEPINHLDIPSRTRFEEALSQFEGTILAVVHDRYFIEQFATEIWYVADGSIETT
ncbi:MAG: ABC-F family ATP-binding cassette domain-containing protein [Chloroflexi bacterium]|nr:ABC-F family ATP-binding cassette domain-containing protein [Chloroflexota bacterium]